MFVLYRYLRSIVIFSSRDTLEEATMAWKGYTKHINKLSTFKGLEFHINTSVQNDLIGTIERNVVVNPNL